MESVMTVGGRGNRFWKNAIDELHREDGPAVEWFNGYKAWWINGKRHRDDGPAIEWVNGDKSWYINGEELTEQEFNKWRLANKPLTYIDMTVRVKRNFSNNIDLWV